MPVFNEARCVFGDPFLYGPLPADGATGVSVTFPFVKQCPKVQLWNGSNWVTTGIADWKNIVLNATPPIEGVSRYAGRGYVQHDITGSLYANTTYTFCFTLDISFVQLAQLGVRTETFTTPTSSFTTGDGSTPPPPPPPPPSTPTLSSPSDGETGIYLNTDWLLQLEWDDEDAEGISLYTVWFYDPAVGWMEQTDRSRYSIVGYFMWLGYTLNYNTTYSWFVRKTIDGVDYDSPIWTFTTEDFKPPVYSYRWKVPYGGGDPVIVPSGENNQITVKRLIAAANNTIYYEDV